MPQQRKIIDVYTAPQKKGVRSLKGLENRFVSTLSEPNDLCAFLRPFRAFLNQQKMFSRMYTQAHVPHLQSVTSFTARQGRGWTVYSEGGVILSIEASSLSVCVCVCVRGWWSAVGFSAKTSRALYHHRKHTETSHRLLPCALLVHLLGALLRDVGGGGLP